MTINWDQYLSEVLPEVQGCPDQTAINAVRATAIDFCEKTRLWRASFGPLSLVAGTSTYPLDVPANTALVTVIQAAVLSNGAWGDIAGPYSEEMMDAEIFNWREKTIETLPSRYLNDVNTNGIRVYPIPTTNQASVLKGQMALKPTRASVGGDDALYNDWLDVIASGAKARLMANLASDWRNPEGAAYHDGLYRDGRAKAIARILKGGRASLTAYFQPFR